MVKKFKLTAFETTEKGFLVPVLQTTIFSGQMPKAIRPRKNSKNNLVLVIK